MGDYQKSWYLTTIWLLNLSIILHVTNNMAFQNLDLCLTPQERVVVHKLTTFLLKMEKSPFVQICHFPNTSLWKVQKSNP